MKVTVFTRGNKEFTAKVKKLERRLKNMRPLYKSWGIQVLKWIQENYRTSGGKLIGGRWKQLQPSTIQSRRRRSNRPLMDTGHLLKQWNYRLRGKGVAVGNPSKIAEYHEKGTRPYEIEPVNRKVLWFGVTPAQRRRGQQLGGHHQWRIKSKPYKPWPKGRTPGVFAKKVKHPGLPQRRQLPTKEEIIPNLIQVTDKWLEKVVR